MGKVFSSYIKRPVKNWNVENRAHQFIEKKEKFAAPRHPSTVAAFEQFVSEHPEIREEVAKKDEQLAVFLKGMVVNPERMGEISSRRRKLPEDRRTPTNFEFGYLEPKKIRPGRCSLRQALSFLEEHKSDPDEVGSAQSIARRYKLDVKRVSDVLSRFSIFNVERPKSLPQGAAKKDDQFSAKQVSGVVNHGVYKKI